MKRLFTLFAAMCCMVSVALAEFADGVKIYIDNEEVLASEQACFQSDKIVSGHMSYDPTYHILYMVKAQIGVSTSGSPALWIEGPEGADFTVIIQLCGSAGSILTSNGLGAASALQLDCPVEIRGYNLQLTCTGTMYGVLLTNKPLTVTGGASLQAQGGLYGVRGLGPEVSTLKIERGNLTAINDTENESKGYACVSGVNLIMEGSYISVPDGAKWSAEKDGSIVTSGDKYVADDIVKIKQQNHLLYVYPSQGIGTVYEDMSIRIGKYTLKKGDAAQPNPTPHTGGDKFTVTLSEGPEGKQWEGSPLINGSYNYKWTGDAPNGEIEVTSSSEEKAYKSRAFFKSVKLNHKMYMLNNQSEAALYETSNFGSLTYMWSMPTDVDNATNITYANDGEDGAGNMYYSIEDGSQSQIKKISWNVYLDDYDGAEVLPASAKQSTYYPFAGLSYNWVDRKLYGIAKKSDNKWYLVEVKPNTKAISEIGVLDKADASNPPIAMACDKNGDIYCMVYQESDPLLCKVNKSNGKMTVYSHPGYTSALKNGSDITVDNMYKFHSMVFDYETNMLYWWGYTALNRYFIFEINMTTGHADVNTTVAGGNNVDINVGMFQELPKVYDITAKTADGSYGTTLVEGKSSFKALDGSTVTLTATGDPTEGTVFKQWKDGNKDNPRTILVTQDSILEAEYWYGEGVVMYPVWIGGKQFHSNRLEMNNATNAAITAGKATYSPDNNSLTLDNLTINVTSGKAIVVGEEAKANKLTINWVNTSSIKGTMTGTPMELIKSEVTMTGGSFSIDGTGCGILLNKGSKLTFEGAKGTVKSLSYGIKSFDAADNDKVIVRGSALTIDGGTNPGSYATYNVSSVEWKYVTPDPSDAKFDKEKKLIVNGSDVEQKKITFTADPVLRCTPVTEGTGSFTLKLKDGTGETFTNIGYFEKDAEVNITPKPATDFVFGYWTDDPNWGDWSKKSDWMKASREYKKETAGEEELKAQFYAKMKATATWYCVHSAAFEQFKSSDFGGGSFASTSDASSISAGDYNGSQYYVADGGKIKRFSFSSVTKDKEQANYATATEVADYTGTITDMAYNFTDSRFYLVKADTKLYKLNVNDKKVEELGDFIQVKDAIETKVTITCIAIDGDGKKYVLSSDGKLYIVKKEDLKEKKITVEAVGDKGGSVEAFVGTSPQSMAFDHQSGDLYWGAGDYMRLINTKTAKSYPAADLGLTGGSQGYVKALHRRDHKVTVTVEVAPECKDMGTVTAGPGEDTEFSILQGKEVTITATPAEGYAFKQWIIKDEEGEEPITEATYTVAASETTYVAYFEVSVEGLEDIKSSESGVEKVLHEGQLYIIKGEKVYNMTGSRVK